MLPIARKGNVVFITERSEFGGHGGHVERRRSAYAEVGNAEDDCSKA